MEVPQRRPPPLAVPQFPPPQRVYYWGGRRPRGTKETQIVSPPSCHPHPTEGEKMEGSVNRIPPPRITHLWGSQHGWEGGGGGWKEWGGDDRFWGVFQRFRGFGGRRRRSGGGGGGGGRWGGPGTGRSQPQPGPPPPAPGSGRRMRRGRETGGGGDARWGGATARFPDPPAVIGRRMPLPPPRNFLIFYFYFPKTAIGRSWGVVFSLLLFFFWGGGCHSVLERDGGKARSPSPHPQPHVPALCNGSGSDPKHFPVPLIRGWK